MQFIGNDAMKLGLNNFSLDVGVTYMDTADLGRRNALPICTERLSLLVPDTEPFHNRTTISWKEAAELPLAMLRPSMHERRFVNQVFAQVGCQPVPKVESEIDPPSDVPSSVHRAVHDHSLAISRGCPACGRGPRRWTWSTR